MNTLKPRNPAPELSVNTKNGPWKLSDKEPKKLTLIAIYRGLHCPICKSWLQDLNSKYFEFFNRGVDIIAISSDNKERAEEARREWNLDRLLIGYDLSREAGCEWGLYLSKGIKEGEPDIFFEPGLFLVEANGDLYSSVIQSMPFARPSFSDILEAIDFIEKEKYPPRGEA